MRTVRVALVEDHDMVREGLVAVLQADERFDVAGAAATIKEFRDEVDAWQPDVVVADYRLPDGRGTDIVAATEAPVLVISGTELPRVIDDAVRAGCAGFVSKYESARHLADNVAVVAGGGSVFPVAELRRIVDVRRSRHHDALTSRELEVLRLLAQALVVSEIADQLSISHHTVRNHIRSLLQKLGARSQLEAIVIALRIGLVDLYDGTTG